jgi:hypothetical protein
MFVPNNSYAQMLVTTNDMLQSSISQTIHLQANSSGSPPSTWCSPLPPSDLRRGMDGHVPPELQSDPRYQAWLGCQNRQSTHAPPTAVARHLPMAATDFIPAVPGHPYVEQFLLSQPYTDEQRAALRLQFDEISARVARAARPNNLAAVVAAAVCGAMYLIGNEVSDADSDRYLIAVNDRLGTSRDVAAMSPIEKQNASDALIFQITAANLLANAGPDYPQAKEVSVQIAQTLLLQLTGSQTGRLVY